MHVELQEVSYSLPGRPLFTDLSHNFSGAKSVAIMGPSGSGKSTLLGLISGHLTPHKGTVRRVRGNLQDVTPAWIFQSSSLLPRRSALENSAVPSLMTGSTKTAAVTRGHAALTQVGLAHLAKVRVSKLSGGERQRVAVAGAIAAQSTLILADEPTASLDPYSRGQVVLALKQAADSGSLVLVATHDSWVAERCDESLRIHEGRLIG